MSVMRPRLAWLAGLLMLAGCSDGIPTLAEQAVQGETERGRELIYRFGCGSCHVIPGVANADGTVGPPLTQWASRNYIAGAIVNQPENLMLWLMDPETVEPGTAMPEVGVSKEQARHIAAYLYTLQ